jgi:hypothetical protein
MYHTIEFTADVLADLERSPRHPLERVLFRAGTCSSVQVKPYVAQDGESFVAVADLFFSRWHGYPTGAFSLFLFPGLSIVVAVAVRQLLAQRGTFFSPLLQCCSPRARDLGVQFHARGHG